MFLLKLTFIAKPLKEGITMICSHGSVILICKETIKASVNDIMCLMPQNYRKFKQKIFNYFQLRLNVKHQIKTSILSPGNSLNMFNAPK